MEGGTSISYGSGDQIGNNSQSGGFCNSSNLSHTWAGDRPRGSMYGHYWHISDSYTYTLYGYLIGSCYYNTYPGAGIFSYGCYRTSSSNAATYGSLIKDIILIKRAPI